MTKTEMLNTLAQGANLKKKEIECVVDGLTDLIVKTLKKDRKIKLPGLGIFVVKDRKARMARNPRTGEMVKVKAKTVVKFRVAKPLKEAVLT